MPQILIAFHSQHVSDGAGEMLFERRQPMRFEFVALLAAKRVSMPGDQAWVTLEEVARLKTAASGSHPRREITKAPARVKRAKPRRR